MPAQNTKSPSGPRAALWTRGRILSSIAIQRKRHQKVLLEWKPKPVYHFQTLKRKERKREKLKILYMPSCYIRIVFTQILVLQLILGSTRIKHFIF